ncbi:MAG: hypothetical protein R3255_09700, partial [Candidatus Lokiarchaeia archaeon]|nr:hypothetical protein [Candidatus Lokiarchaeia archaeon]
VLRDYSGAEVFSIEFDLFNIDEKSTQVNIYPQSMIFIPGKYKDCESLLLALKPETGVLNIHKSRKSLNNISRLFFEVEEFSDRPDLNKQNKQQIYRKFASRFNQKLYGEIVEEKWNKKLIGISKTLPTEQEMLNTYARVVSNVEISWYKKPMEINLINSKYQKIKTSYDGQQAIEHLKFSISEPSANFIVDKTLNLGTNLINLANTGTIDESLDEIVIFIVDYIIQEIKKYHDPHNTEWLISTVNSKLIDLQSYINKFLEYSKNFLSSGEIGDLDILLNKFEYFLLNKGKLESVDFSPIWGMAKKYINQSMTQKKNLRIIELNSVLSYFSELVNKGKNIVILSLPKFLAYRRLKALTNKLTDKTYEKFNQEQKPAKIIGLKIVEKFKLLLFNRIETHPSFFKKEIKFNERELTREFRSLVDSNIDAFFNEIELKIEDLISFTEIQMESKINNIKNHIEKFKKYSTELNFLLSYVLRHSTINRYIKDEPDKEISDPVSFANRFHRFLEKRIGGINLEWKFYVLDWIIDYSKKYLRPEAQRVWTLVEVYNDFIGYFEERAGNEQKIENFLIFLDTYIAKLTNPEEKKLLFEFYKNYESSIGINTEFPKYVKNSIRNELNSLNHQEENLIPFNFFNFDDKETLYDYIKNTELKYFSKLVPRPLTVILKHTLTNEERDLFNGDLFHVLDFKFWHNNARFELSDNFKEVYREW